MVAVKKRRPGGRRCLDAGEGRANHIGGVNPSLPMATSLEVKVLPSLAVTVKMWVPFVTIDLSGLLELDDRRVGRHLDLE